MISSTSSQSICIIGCGWLGFPIAVKLNSLGFKVFGSTTSNEKLEQLTEAGIQSFIFNLDDSNSDIPVCDHYFINIPPSKTQNYLKNLESLFNKIPDHAKNVIFCSTTSVYEDHPGQFCSEEQVVPGIVEKSVNQDESNHGTPRRTLIIAEGIFHRHQNSIILRLSGLFGPNRHPVKFLSGRKNISRPSAVVNLIHLDDIITTTIKLLAVKPDHHIYNVTSAEHPTREEYYTIAAKYFGLTPPEFDSSDKTIGKIVDHTKLTSLLGYEPTLKTKNL